MTNNLAAQAFPQTGKSLFSQHYLETRLPGHPEWAEDPQPAFDAVQALWHKARQYGQAWNEAQTEDEFVKPVLAALGWSYIPQVKNSRSGRVNRPDYALFADEATKNASYPHQGNDDAFYTRALAIAEAKYWGTTAEPQGLQRPRHLEDRQQPQPPDGQLPGRHALSVGHPHQRPGLAPL